MEQWNDPTVVRAWVERNDEDNTERAQTIELLLKIVADHLATADVPRSLLDVGCGHGLIASRMLDVIPDSVLVGVDGSPPMLELAQQRLEPCSGRFTLGQADFETMSLADLPGGPFGAAFAVQSIHNTTDEGKKRALASIRDALAPHGLFVLVDRIRLVTPQLFNAYRSVWDVLGSSFNGQQREGRSFDEHERSVAERGDKPGSLEQNIVWLREAGFSQVAALHVVGVRAIIAASVS